MSGSSWARYFFAVIAFAPIGVPPSVQRMMAVAALMATWWVSEAIPLAATSLLPLALFPFLGLGTAAESAAILRRPPRLPVPRRVHARASDAAPKRNGLSAWMGEQLQFFSALPLPLFILIIVTLIVSLTEFASNTASTAMSIPILAATATSMGLSPLVLAIPATIAASCAFMLPAATPPNAIVFGTGYFTASAGIGVNLIGVVLISLLSLLLVGPLFGV